MNIPGLNPSQFISSNASVGLRMDLLFVVTCLKRREDQISIVHNLKPKEFTKNLAMMLQSTVFVSLGDPATIALAS